MERLNMMKFTLMQETKELKKTPRIRTLEKRGKRTYNPDKPPIFTIVNRETGYSVFIVLKNLFKKKVH